MPDDLTIHPMIRMQPALRLSGDLYQIAVTYTWEATDTPKVTMGVTVVELLSQSLCSECVMHPLEVSRVGALAHSINREAIDLIRRSRNPFDDLT